MLSGLAAHRDASFSISYDQQPTNVRGLLISGSYFPTLQLNPAAGRLIGPSDDTPIGANFVVVLGYNFWISRFGGDPAIVGKTMIVNGQTMTIIGVAPRGFQSTSLSVDPQVFAPISMRHELSPWFHDFENRRSYWVYLFGRMKPGVTLAQAEAGLNKVYKPIINDVEAPLQKGMSEQTLAKFKAKEVKVEDGRRGQSVIHQEAKTPMTLLLGITVIVLLIACANIANLLLARGANRAMEMGVRLALGASRRQLLTQLITESLLLAAMGGIASLFVAQWTLRAVSTMLPNDGAASLTFSLEPRILLFAAALSVVTGFLFGMFPALHSTRGDLVTTIRSNAGQISGHRTAARFRSSLVTAQIALSMALLIAAGLFMKSLSNISRVDLGVHVDDVVVFGMSPERAGYDSTRAQLFYGQVEERLAAIPGVTGVTSSMVPLLAGDNWGNSVKVQGFPDGPDVDNNSRMNEVGGGYFHMLGIKMLAGRDLTTADAQGAAKVVVVNESFAKKFKLGNDVVGKYMGLGGEHDSMDIQIVGLVQNAKYSDVKDSVPPVYYRPWRQDRNATYMNFYVRSSLPPAELLKRRSRGDAPAGRDRAGGGPQDDAAADPRERVARPHDLHSLGIVRGARDAARGRGTLRRARVHRGAAHARDRRAHGARRQLQQCAADGDAAGGLDDAHRRHHRPRRGVRPRSRGCFAALPVEQLRPRGVRDRHRDPRDRRERRGLAAGEKGVESRSDQGAQVRVGDQERQCAN